LASLGDSLPQNARQAQLPFPLVGLKMFFVTKTPQTDCGLSREGRDVGAHRLRPARIRVAQSISNLVGETGLPFPEKHGATPIPNLSQAPRMVVLPKFHPERWLKTTGGIVGRF